MPGENPLYLCGACGLDFAGLRYFDQHRVGRHEPLERRCLDTDELEALGYRLDSRGRWGDPAAAEAAREAFSAVQVTPQTPSEAESGREAA